MTDTKKSNFENINDLLKALLWPLVAVTVILMFKGEVRTMFQNSSKVTLGSFSMEIQREAANQGQSELSTIITKLSIPGLKKLMAMSSAGRFGLVSNRRPYQGNEGGYSLNADLSVWAELEKSGLISGESFNISSLIDHFKKLGAKETKVFYNDEGSTTTADTKQYQYEGMEYFISNTQLNDSEKAKLENFSVALTEKGRKAVNIIVETTARQIKE